MRKDIFLSLNEFADRPIFKLNEHRGCSGYVKKDMTDDHRFKIKIFIRD